MATYTMNSQTSLEEQRISHALDVIAAWKIACACNGKFCESFGCDSLEEIAQILRGEFHGERMKG